MSRGPRRGPMQPKGSMKGQWSVLGRVFQIMFRNYLPHFIIVCLCIFGATWCTLQSTTFMQKLIDSYLTPMLSGQLPVEEGFASLAGDLTRLAVIMAFGVLFSFLNQRIMINVGQGTMLNIRNELFEKMEKLPISYFDTHAHGDVMSVYTNDVDTLRQLIGQSITTVIDSLVTIVMTFIYMITMSWQLTGLSIIMIFFTVGAAAWIGGRAGKNFVRQQKALGQVNGYIEEMVSGQKVVKVFCHEEKAEEKFRAGFDGDGRARRGGDGDAGEAEDGRRAACDGDTVGRGGGRVGLDEDDFLFAGGGGNDEIPAQGSQVESRREGGGGEEGEEEGGEGAEERVHRGGIQAHSAPRRQDWRIGNIGGGGERQALVLCLL